jgi:hypothetical protein
MKRLGGLGKSRNNLNLFFIPNLAPFLLYSRSPIGNHAHNIGVGDELTVDFSLASHALYARAYAQGGYFKRQCVARHNWPAKSRLTDTGKEHEFLIAVLNFTQCKHGSYLRERFNNEDSWHHGGTRKVSLKEGLVNADLLYSDDSFAGNQLYYSIHEKKRITMWQEFLYRLGIENSFHDQN